MKKWTFEGRLLALTLAAGLPGSLLGLILLWSGGYESRTQWTLTLLVILLWLSLAFAVRNRVTFKMQTLSNVVAALREGDFSVRARTVRRGEGLTELVRELNTLIDTLRRTRLGAVETAALLRKVMEEIESALFTFDGGHRLLLLNPAAERLMGRPAERLLGQTAAELGLEECLTGSNLRTVELEFPGGEGRWGVSRTQFRQQGLPHQLLVLTDLSRTLREEERRAWQRLIRVLGHELNNSLTPIKSIAGSLETLMDRQALPPDWKEDARRGLRVISSRAEALARFTGAYSRLTRLPDPEFMPVNLAASIQRVVSLETRLKVSVRNGAALRVWADPDQLEQALINLIRNAVDAALETGGDVEVGWEECGRFVEIAIRDEGPGLSGTANLFVPFFTTKPTGTGIGLAISRQIAEAHGGRLILENRREARGCQARLLLPLNREMRENS